MTEVKLHFSDDQFKAALSEAVLNAISDESRDALIREAVEGIVKREIVKDRLGRNKAQPSIVDNAFARTVSEIGRGVVKELVENDPQIRPMVEAVVRQMLIAFLTDEKAGEKIAGALWEAIEKAARS
jgi:hypothetical protein